MKKLLLISILISTIYCQSPAGAIFVLISPSPGLNGMAGIGACLPSSDAFASFYNPANGIDVGKGLFYSEAEMSTNWLPNLADDIVQTYEVKNLGLIPESSPFQVTISQHKYILDLGKQYRTNVNGLIMDSSEIVYSMSGHAMGIRHENTFRGIPYTISMGLTDKQVTQEFLGSKSTDKLMDYGFLLASPINIQVPIENLKSLSLSFNPGFGYSVSNVGDSITVNEYSSPTPKTVRTGLSGDMSVFYRNEWELLRWKLGRMASDIMVNEDKLAEGKIEYQKGFGDINFLRNVVQSKSDSGITIYRGNEWTVFGAFTLRTGFEKNISGRIIMDTHGYGYRLSGLFYILHWATRQKIYDILLNHIDFRYDYSIYKTDPGHPLEDTEFEAWTLTVNNIDKLILKLFD